jgi:hypothetical protein
MVYIAGKRINGNYQENEQLVFWDDTEVRIIVSFNPSTLIELWKHNEKLVVEILLNNGSGDGGANAATASVADCQDVNGVLHGRKGDGGEKKAA